jgi:ligand-binding SRPBCC domain-containing protein
MPGFTLETAIGATPDVAYRYAIGVEAHLSSMSHAREQAIGGVTSGRLRLGDEVTWRARHFGLWWRMTVRISADDPPRSFVDEQVSGPFQHWRHEHYFEPRAEGVTLMRDVVDFSAPYGLAGRTVASVALGPYLRVLIQRRNTYLATLCAG